MFIEDTDGIESSSSYQQQPTFSFDRSLPVMTPINPQRPSYQEGMQTSTSQIHQIAPSATVNFQPDLPQQSTASFSMPNTTTVSTTKFPTIDQLSTEVPVNSIKYANPDKLTMIKSFSNESGMNKEWAEK